MKKMQKVITLLCLFVLFGITISVPLASSEEKEFPTSSDLNLLEEVSPIDHDEGGLQSLDMIEELELEEDEDTLSTFATKNPVYKTDAEAKKAATKLGYTKVKETCGNKKVAIFGRDKKTKKGPGYISRDLDGHNGGAWKGANLPRNICSKSTRSGTYDKNLNRIGD